MSLRVAIAVASLAFACSAHAEQLDLGGIWAPGRMDPLTYTQFAEGVRGSISFTLGEGRAITGIVGNLNDWHFTADAGELWYNNYTTPQMIGDQLWLNIPSLGIFVSLEGQFSAPSGFSSFTSYEWMARLNSLEVVGGEHAHLGYVNGVLYTPEPSTWAMLGLGLIGLGRAGRRRT